VGAADPLSACSSGTSRHNARLDARLRGSGHTRARFLNRPRGAIDDFYLGYSIVMLDREFDTSGSPFRRSLRPHEFGHALRYNHVTGWASVMNQAATLEPNAFDRDAAKISFQGPPLNRSPDVDPDPFTGNLRALASQVVWAGAR
jgi:hypothetical protein